MTDLKWMIDESFFATLATHPAVIEQMRLRAEKVVAAAKATAPVDTGKYRDSIHVVDEIGANGAVSVIADVPYASIIEFGWASHTRPGERPAHHILGQALDAAKSGI